LVQVVVEPAHGAVTHLVVECRPPGRGSRLLPVALVESATQEAITLAIGGDELEGYWPSRRLPRPPASLTTTPRPDSADPPLRDAYFCAVRPAPPVLTLREKLGRWQGRPRRLNPDPEPADDDEVTHDFVRQGAIFTEKLVIPIFVASDLASGDFSRGERPTLVKAAAIPLYFFGDGDGRPFGRDGASRCEPGLPA
jgi:hypothetical protein